MVFTALNTDLELHNVRASMDEGVVDILAGRGSVKHWGLTLWSDGCILSNVALRDEDFCLLQGLTGHLTKSVTCIKCHGERKENHKQSQW